MDAAVVTNRQLLRIIVIVRCRSRKATAVLRQQQHVEAGLPGKRNKLGIRNRFGKVTLELLQEQSFIKVFETLEALPGRSS